MTKNRASIDSSTSLPSINAALSRPSPEIQRRMSMLQQAGQQRHQQSHTPSYGGAGHHHSPESPPSKAELSKAKKSAAAAAAKEKKRRKPSISVGDDLPHMPSSPPSRIVDSSTSRVKFANAVDPEDKFTSLPPPSSMLRNSTDSPHHDILAAALHGTNSMLVDREVSRLRDRGAKELKMKKRIWAGVATLFLLVFSTYIMAQYIVAWLALAPATVLLSEAVAGTSVSPDPQLRLYALLCIAISATSVAGTLVVAWYLRASRRRSCGTAFAYFIAILSVMLALILALANLLFIVLWRKQYGAHPEDPMARTRDVGTRCVGRWDLDVLWSAASNSQTSDDSDTVDHCPKDPNQAMKLYLTAGGFRLVLLVFLCTAWLVLLGKYNKALGVDSLEGVDGKESAEMNVLLAEEKGHASSDKLYDDATGWGYAGDGDEVDPAIAAKLRELEEDEDEDMTLTPSNARAYAAVSHSEDGYYSEDEDKARLPLPRLNRFDWQRGEPSMAGGEYYAVQEQHHAAPAPPMPHPAHYGHGHAKESSAGGWSAGLFARLGDAVGWNAPSVQHHEEDGRVPDNFGGYTSAPPPSYAPHPTTTYANHAPPSHSQVNHAPHSSSHAYAQGTHDVYGQQAEHDRAPTRLGVSAWFRRDASDSVDEGQYAPQQAHPQQHHQQAYSSQHHQHAHAQPTLAPPPRAQQPVAPSPPQERRESIGNDLPHMPSASISPAAPPSKSPRTRARDMSEQYSAPAYASASEEPDEDEFWKGSANADGGGDSLGALPQSNINAPTYIRTLGRLVHRLSAIESVGSGERGSEGSTGAPGSSVGGGGGGERERHGKGMSWGLGSALGFGESGGAKEAPGGWLGKW